MQPLVHTVEPIFCGHDVPERVALGQRDHLGHTRRTGGEVNQNNIVCGPLRFVWRGKRTALLFRFFRIVDKSFAFSDAHCLYRRGDLFYGFQNIFAQFVFIHRNDHFDLRLLHAVCDVFFHQHMRSGNGDRADF